MTQRWTNIHTIMTALFSCWRLKQDTLKQQLYVEQKASRNFLPRSMYIRKFTAEFIHGIKLPRLKSKKGLRSF